MHTFSGFARVIALSVTLSGGCTLANLTPQARFAESTNTLNDSTRWGRVDAALTQVSPKYLDKFVARHAEWGGAISIADFDIVNMQIAEDRQGAMSEVALSWYKTGGVILHQSTITQRWETDHGKFRLVDEVVRAGDPRVFVAEEALPKTPKADHDPS
jgi:hypothetical protein